MSDLEEEEEDRTEQEEEVFWLLPGQIVKIMCVCEKILEKSGSIPRYFECDSCQMLLELPDSEKVCVVLSSLACRLLGPLAC